LASRNDHGTELVNDQGEGRELVPIDNEPELEFAERITTSPQ
jgi:hypothetical protein